MILAIASFATAQESNVKQDSQVKKDSQSTAAKIRKVLKDFEDNPIELRDRNELLDEVKKILARRLKQTKGSGNSSPEPAKKGVVTVRKVKLPESTEGQGKPGQTVPLVKSVPPTPQSVRSPQPVRPVQSVRSPQPGQRNQTGTVPPPAVVTKSVTQNPKGTSKGVSNGKLKGPETTTKGSFNRVTDVSVSKSTQVPRKSEVVKKSEVAEKPDVAELGERVRQLEAEVARINDKLTWLYGKYQKQNQVENQNQNR